MFNDIDLENRHDIHGLSLGIILFALTKNIPLSLLVGGGAYAYMKKFGHKPPINK